MTETAPHAPSSTGRAFPLRVAAVDVGSNAIRFTAAEFLDLARRVELETRRVPVRLGHSAYLTGLLDSEAMTIAVEALSSFRTRIDALEIAAVRAVATSAVRETRNGGELVERVRRAAGLRIEPINGQEEARLVWLAVRDRFPLQGRWILVDLGGGSLEVSVVRQERVEWSESHRLGTVRLLEELGGTDPGSGERLESLIARYSNELRIPVLDDDGLAGLVATGGNIEALAKLAGAERDARGVSRLPLPELDAVNRRLAGLTYGQRVKKLGLREDRADVIIPAGRIYARVAELSGAPEIVVPNVGVKDGILVDLVAESGPA